MLSDSGGICHASHGDHNAAIKRIHVNPGHPGGGEMYRIFQDAGYPQWVLELVSNFQCSACGSDQQLGIPRPAIIQPALSFNDRAQVDLCYWKHPTRRRQYQILSMVDEATGFNIAARCTPKAAEHIWTLITRH